MQVKSNPCSSCFWYRHKNLNLEPFIQDPKIDQAQCLAFPEGIPEEIFDGETRHTKKQPGQVNNIVYRNLEKVLQEKSITLKI